MAEARLFHQEDCNLDYLKGKTVAVRGKVYLYDGVCNVEVTSPDQITVL